MAKLNRIFLIYSIALVFLIGPFYWSWSGERDMVLKFQGKIFSAFLQGVPLRQVLEELKRQKGVWFKVTDSLFDEEVTVQFADLTLEDGIKRILASKNYSLVYDWTGEVTGVVVLGRMASNLPTDEGGTIRARRNISSQPSSGLVPLYDKEPEDFEVFSNNIAPGGPVEVTKEELPNFRVIKDSPPPGVPVEVTEKELDHFEIIRNCYPPGGPVEITAEELKYFEIIKDCPPPGN